MVQWSHGKGMNETIRSHTVRSNDASVCILLCNGPEIPTTFVHWVHEQNTSLPCPGESECVFHDKALIWKGYAPVLIFKHVWQWKGFAVADAMNAVRRFNYSQWHRRCLELTQNCADLCEIGKRGMPFVIKRPDWRRNAPLELQPLDLPPLVVPDIVDFDPKRVMERAFNGNGKRKEEKGGTE